MKQAQVLRIDGLKLGLIHGFPVPEEIPWTSWDYLMDLQFGEAVDVIVCGDTHVALIREHNGVLMVNPGSPTYPNNIAPALGTVAIMTIENGVSRAEIIQLQESP